jgi:hypothetical protein
MHQIKFTFAMQFISFLRLKGKFYFLFENLFEILFFIRYPKLFVFSNKNLILFVICYSFSFVHLIRIRLQNEYDFSLFDSTLGIRDFSVTLGRY